MEPTTVSVLNIPKLRDPPKDSLIVKTLIEKFRGIRLDGLKNAPEAFSSRYEVVSERPFEFFRDAFFDPTKDHFIALDRPLPGNFDIANSEHAQALLDANWIGMLVLSDTKEESTSTIDSSLLIQDSKHESSPARETQALGNKPLSFELNGVFVYPEARGSGCGKALVDAALAKGEAAARRREVDFACVVLVYSTNETARRLYEKTGFHVTRAEKRSGGPSERIVLHMMLTRPFAHTASSVDPL